ncbi:hypothetical protein BGZ63DRAFT_425415 [Mariannaea sp. PMI_226]|nr:hypothetical protein BGZ63DRAFT_425415 [Mariannaea sp. PMI_226]
MLPTLAIATIAILLSGTHAAVPRLHPRLDSASDRTPTTTPTVFTTPGASSQPPPFFSSKPTSLSDVTTDSTTAGTPTTTSNPAGQPTTTTTSLTSETNDGTTTSGGSVVITTTTTASAGLPTTTQATKTGAFVAVNVGATSASGAFTNLAAAASSLAANPSPSPEEVETFNQQANDNEKQLSALQDEVKGIDTSKLNDKDSHKVEESLAALAALLAWYGPKLAALGPVAATPALALPVLAELAPAFAAAAAAGGLLSKALDDLFDLGEDDDGGDDDHPTKTDASHTEKTTAASTTEATTETTTASTTTEDSCATPLPYDVVIPPLDDDQDFSQKRSITDGMMEYNVFEKRDPRFPNIPCPANIQFPNYPTAPQIYDYDKNGGSGFASGIIRVSQRYYERTNTCNAPKLQKNSRSSYKQSDISGRFNVDHVWELKFLSMFFQSFLVGRRGSSNLITCTEFETIFRASQGKCSPWFTVVSAVPSEQNPELAVISPNINSIKGRIFRDQDLTDSDFVNSFANDPAKTIQTLWDMGLAIEFLKRSEIRNLYETTNQRMYNTMAGIDAMIEKKAITLGNPNFKFADTYETFMSPLMTQAAKRAWGFVFKYKAQSKQQIQTMLDANPKDPKVPPLQVAWLAFNKSPYASIDFYKALSVNTDLSSNSSPVSISKRDEGDSCPFNPPTTTESPASETTAPGESTVTQPSTVTEASTVTEPNTATEQTTVTDHNTETEPTTTAPETTTTAPETTTSAADPTTTAAEPTTTTQPTTTAAEPTTTAPEQTTTTTSQLPSETPTTQQQPETTSTSLVVVIEPSSTQTTFSTSVLTSQAPPDTTEPATQTQSVPDAQTITTNGMVCTLIRGSNNPVCTPQETHTANPGGTNVHVNSGCIMINGSPRCASDAGSISNVYQSFYNVMSNTDDQYGTTLILSGFDSNDKLDPNVKATCQLQARWPSNYGDVYFGADGCLYDSQSNKIFNQCCSTPDINNSGDVVNPYSDPRPAAACNRTPGFGFVHFEIFMKGSWVGDGSELWKQVGGCGLLTGKAFGTNNDIHTDGSDQNIGEFRSDYLMKFNLPITFKSGCVGRAIGSAGGPQGRFC